MLRPRASTRIAFTLGVGAYLVLVATTALPISEGAFQRFVVSFGMLAGTPVASLVGGFLAAGAADYFDRTGWVQWVVFGLIIVIPALVNGLTLAAGFQLFAWARRRCRPLFIVGVAYVGYLIVTATLVATNVLGNG